MNIATIESVLLALLVADAVALTVLVIMQQGKGADAGASFGSGSSNTMFGSLGAASFLTKSTAWLAIGFFLIAFGLAYIAKERAASAGNIGIPTLDSTPAPVAPTGDIPTVTGPGGDLEGNAEGSTEGSTEGNSANTEAAIDAALQSVQEAVEAVDENSDVPALDMPQQDIPQVEEQP